MNTEDSEFERIAEEAKRRAAQDDDDTQVYTSEVAEAYSYRCGYEDGAVAEREACAKVADGWPDYDVQGLAEAIRARKNK